MNIYTYGMYIANRHTENNLKIEPLVKKIWYLPETSIGGARV